MQSHVQIMTKLRSLDREREQHMRDSSNLRALSRQQSSENLAAPAVPARTMPLTPTRRPWKPAFGWLARFAS